MTIVYTSETGFTKEYATLLAEMTQLPLYDWDTALTTLEKNVPIVYLGWLRAGKVVGLDKAKKQFQIQAVGCVGIRPDIENMNQTLRKMSAVPSQGGFFLQGGYAPDKVQGGKKKALQMVFALLSKAIQSQKSLKPEEEALLRVMKEGGSFVSKENLLPLATYIRS